MKLLISFFLLVAAVAALARAENVQIAITNKIAKEDCPRKSKKGDLLYVHYTGYLEDGTMFDTSIGKNSPFRFTLGRGQVIQGWDRGMLGMCIGEQRKLTIPAALAYGNRATGSIPAGSTLVFDTELLSIGGYTPPEPSQAGQAKEIELDTPAKTQDEATEAAKVVDTTPSPDPADSSSEVEEMFTILPIDTDAEPETAEKFRNKDEL